MSEELTLLKDRAERMGLSFHPSIGITRLKEKMAVHTGDIEIKSEPGQRKETISQRNTRLRKEANKLIRIRLTNMDPNRKSLKGDFFSVSNSAIGVVKKYIPFYAEEGWHIPQVLLGSLQEKEYQSHYTTTVKGKKVNKSKPVKAFAIEILPPLTLNEMKDLAAQQAMHDTMEG